MKIELKFWALWLAFLVVLASPFLLSGCRAKLPPATENNTVTITETLHDTVFKELPDSSAIKALIECQNGKPIIKQVVETKSGRNLHTPALKLNNDVLECDCYADSIKMYAFWKSRQTDQVTTISKPVLIEKQLTWWQTSQIWLGRILIAILLYVLLKMIYNPFKFFSDGE